MIKPTAAAMPPRVMMLRLMPGHARICTVAASDMGTVITAIRVNFRLRRNMRRTSIAVQYRFQTHLVHCAQMPGLNRFDYTSLKHLHPAA